LVSFAVCKWELMMRSLSQDLRGRFLQAIATGASARAAGRRFALSPTTAIRWAKAWHAHGQQDAKPRGRQLGQGAKLAPHMTFLLGLIEAKRDITLQEVALRLAAERGLTAALSTIWRFYAQQGITFKKDRASRRAAARRGRRRAAGLVRPEDRP
jgi:transposase